MTLSAGTLNPDGSWTLTHDQLDGLAIMPLSGYVGNFGLTITAVTTEANGDFAETVTHTKVTLLPGTKASEPEAERPNEGSASPISLPPAPNELDWSDEVELGVLDTVAEIDQTLERLDGQMRDLDLPAPTGELTDRDLGYAPVFEVPPMVAEERPDRPVPPPGTPLFEFTRATGATPPGDPGAAGREGRLVAPSDPVDPAEDQAVRTLREQFAQAFTVLWSLARSLGVRTSADDKAGNERGPSHRR